MARTTRPTRALAAFGVYGRATETEFDILAVADDYRQQLCQLLQAAHMAMLNLRDELFPEIFAAMIADSYADLAVFEQDRQIKQHHSDVRNRNAVTDAQREALTAARAHRHQTATVLRDALVPWRRAQSAFSAYYRRQADWKNVKLLDRRRQMYAAIVWPTTAEPYATAMTTETRVVTPDQIRVDAVLAYAQYWLAHDLEVRALGQQFQPRLHPAIRAEIWEASKPKTSRTAPGMRYQAGRPLQPRPWTKLTIQCGGGGLRVSRAIQGTPQLSLTPLYTNHTASGNDTVYEVRQQIGTEAAPHHVTYRAKCHRELPPDALIQRWTLVVRPSGERVCIPILSNYDFAKPVGRGVLAFDLSWYRRSGGIQVAHLYGEHINERIVLPDWLIDRRMAVRTAQAPADLACNEFLTARGRTPVVDEKQGFEALLVYVAANATDSAAQVLASNCQDSLDRALRVAQRAARCVEEIYRVAAARACRLHSQVVLTQFNLQQLKKYDCRDLLQQNAPPTAVRDRLHVVAPGKLKAALVSYGLELLDFTRRPGETQDLRELRGDRLDELLAGGEVPSPPPADAVETDVITSYVRNLGQLTGAKVQQPRRCSRHAEQPAGAVQV